MILIYILCLVWSLLQILIEFLLELFIFCALVYCFLKVFVLIYLWNNRERFPLRLSFFRFLFRNRIKIILIIIIFSLIFYHVNFAIFIHLSQGYWFKIFNFTWFEFVKSIRIWFLFRRVQVSFQLFDKIIAIGFKVQRFVKVLKIRYLICWFLFVLRI